MVGGLNFNLVYTPESCLFYGLMYYSNTEIGVIFSSKKYLKGSPFS